MLSWWVWNTFTQKVTSKPNWYWMLNTEHQILFLLLLGSISVSFSITSVLSALLMIQVTPNIWIWMPDVSWDFEFTNYSWRLKWLLRCNCVEPRHPFQKSGFGMGGSSEIWSLWWVPSRYPILMIPGPCEAAALGGASSWPVKGLTNQTNKDCTILIDSSIMCQSQFWLTLAIKSSQF